MTDKIINYFAIVLLFKRPGPDSHAVTAQMEAMAIGGPRGEGLAGRRRGALSIQYLEPAYRPQNLGDKKGDFN